jgi:hypothetical protein
MFSSNRKHSKLCTAECWRSATAVALAYLDMMSTCWVVDVRNAEYRIEAVVVPSLYESEDP